MLPGRRTGLNFLFVIFSILSLSAFGQYRQENGGDVRKGAHLYDAWDLRLHVNTELLGNTNPLWTEIGKGPEAGPLTWRCVSCHGWDYLGYEPANKNGLAVPGLTGASAMSQEELIMWLDGSMNPKHDFSKYLTIAAQKDLLAFLQHGIRNYSGYIRSGIFKQGNISSNGENLYKESCRECHGSDGSRINFGTADNPVFLGNIAEEPWRLVHLVRFGHYRIGNTSAEELGWHFQDIFDVVIYTRILPKGESDEIEVVSPDTIDFSDQADTAPMVYASFVMVFVIIIGVTYSGLRNRNQNK